MSNSRHTEKMMVFDHNGWSSCACKNLKAIQDNPHNTELVISAATAGSGILRIKVHKKMRHYKATHRCRIGAARNGKGMAKKSGRFTIETTAVTYTTLVRYAHKKPFSRLLPPFGRPL